MGPDGTDINANIIELFAKIANGLQCHVSSVVKKTEARTHLEI